MNWRTVFASTVRRRPEAILTVFTRPYVVDTSRSSGVVAKARTMPNTPACSLFRLLLVSLLSVLASLPTMLLLTLQINSQLLTQNIKSRSQLRK